MFFNKIVSGTGGVLLYGITPPKLQTAPEKIAEIAQKTLDRIKPLPIDALVVYDVQDESARTNEVRPFPYVSALDPLVYSKEYLNGLQLPKIIYRPAGKYTPTELEYWLSELHAMGGYPVFVGVPSPDFKVKTSLKEAYQLWRKNESHSVVGAVTIPERHEMLRDEDQRILDKMRAGVRFFVSQCVFNVSYAIRLIDAVVQMCAEQNLTMPTVIFTLSACGSEKTLQFIKWLGIHVPDSVEKQLLTSENMLLESVSICTQIAQRLISHCRAVGIPFGFNVESVAIRKEEIEASVNMVYTIYNHLHKN